MLNLTPYLTALVMLLSIIVGTIISPRIQHKMGLQSGRKDVLFRKKLEYFEKIIETIEKNKKTYIQIMHSIKEAKNKKEIKGIIEELRKSRKNFMIMASPLYFNTEKFSEKIVRFVRVEKEIFNRISVLENKEKTDIPVLIEQLKKDFIILTKREEEIIIEMKRELSR